MDFSQSSFVKGFAVYGGATASLYDQLPTSVQAKRCAFGMAMFIGLATSSIMASVVWIDIKGPVYGIVLGLLWFALVTGLERTIMVFMDHDAAHKIIESVFPTKS